MNPKSRATRLRLFLAFLALGTAVFAQRVEVVKDKFTGNAFVNMDAGEQLDTDETGMSRGLVRITITAHVNTKSTFSLYVHLMRLDWMFINEGESLTLKLDGEFFKLTGPGSEGSRSTISGGTILESAPYDIPRTTLERITAAKTFVEFRVVGRGGNYTGTFSDRTITGIKNLLAAVPAADWTVEEVEKRLASPAPPTSPRLRAGIYLRGDSKGLCVARVEPSSPNGAFRNMFIVAVEGQRGTPRVLDELLNAAISRHQAEKVVKVTIASSPKGAESEAELQLAP